MNLFMKKCRSLLLMLFVAAGILGGMGSLQSLAADQDIVILVGHLGRNYVTERWSSESVLANTTGIDAMIDGHSHEEYTTTVKNKNGEEVLLSGGDGMTMFTGCSVLMRDITTDVDALYTYINQDLGGVIGEEYADPRGQGRITIR